MAKKEKLTNSFPSFEKVDNLILEADKMLSYSKLDLTRLNKTLLLIIKNQQECLKEIKNSLL